MADVTLKYKGATIGELSESGNKTIETAGKYCEANIMLEYVKPSGGGNYVDFYPASSITSTQQLKDAAQTLSGFDNFIIVCLDNDPGVDVSPFFLFTLQWFTRTDFSRFNYIFRRNSTPSYGNAVINNNPQSITFSNYKYRVLEISFDAA